MDGAKFDGMMRAWAARGTRRDAVRLLGGVAGTLMTTRRANAAVTCKPPRGRCRKKADCCTGRCNRKHRRCRGCAGQTNYCPTSQSCIPSGQCCADADCQNHCYQGTCCAQQQFEAGLCAPLGSCFDPRGIPGCCQSDDDCRVGCSRQGACCTDARFDAALCAPRGACSCS
jgi:hypothetical protein